MSGSPDVLPFVFLQGAWVWKVVLVAAVGGVVGGVILGRRAIAALRVRRRLAPLHKRTHVVRGTLRGGGEQELVATLFAQPNRNVTSTTGMPQLVTWQPGELWIETNEGSIALAGPVELVAGSKALTTRRGAPAEILHDHLELARDKANWIHRADKNGMTFVRTAALRSLRAGDKVIAAGVIESVPDGEVAAGGSKQVLRPARGDVSLPLAALRPASELLPFPPLLAILLAVATLGVGYKTLSKLGAHWREACAGPDDAKRPFELNNTHACALAAATPGPANVTEAALYRIEQAAPQDRYTRDLALALASRLGDCSSVVRRHMDWFQFEEAAALARRCNEPRWEQRALLWQAKTAEAVAVKLPPKDGIEPRPRVSHLITLGRWADAAQAVDAVAAAYSPDEDDSWRAPRMRAFYRCFADLMRHHAGDAAAAARIREVRDTGDGHLCEAVLAQTVTADARLAMVRDLEQASMASEHARKEPLTTIVWAEGGQVMPDLDVAPERVLVAPAFANRALVVAWLARLHREKLLASPARTADHLRWLAITATFDGDVATASKLATEASALWKPVEPRAGRDDSYDIRHLPAAIALYSDASDVAVELQAPEGVDRYFAERIERDWHRQYNRLLLRAGKRNDRDELYHFDRDYKSALLSDSGTRLAEMLAREDRWAAGDLLAVIPRVTHERDKLVTALSAVRRAYQQDDLDDYPLDLLGLAIEHRAMYQRAGLAAQAKYWDDVYERLDAALADPKKLMALLVWD